MYVPLVLALPFLVAEGGLTPTVPTADEIVAKMIAHDGERQAALHGYTGFRRYVVENRNHHKRAEMLVRMICGEDGSKQFEVVSENGWGGATKHVFPRLLDAEMEAARPDLRERSRITPENYTFEIAGTEDVHGRLAYVISIAPKTPTNISPGAESGSMPTNTPSFVLRGSLRRIRPSGLRVFTSFTSTTKMARSGFPYLIVQ